MAQTSINKAVTTSFVAANIDNPTMSSREIVELTGKEHRNVMRDIRVMLVELHGEGGVLNFEHTQHNEQNGQAYPIYRLPRHETLVLISGYSVQIRSKIIARWDELERQARDPSQVLQNPVAMRGLLLSYCEKVIELQERVDVLEPKGAALDRIARAAGSLCITDAAKSLQMQPKALFRYLTAHGWIYSRIGTSGYFAYQAKLVSGHLEHKVTTVERSDGTEKMVTQVRVTPKGLTTLSRHLTPVLKEVA